MKNNIQRIILFSAPTKKNKEEIYKNLFPKEFKKKILGYMPSDANNFPKKYTQRWRRVAKRYNAEFVYINNCANNSKKQIEKLNSANILIITGGNTFSLLQKLKNTGLDKAIKNFVKKDNFVLGGFSAGALVLTPSISVCNLDKYDDNKVGLKDLEGVGVVDFEIFPHYKPEDKDLFEQYCKTTNNEVRTITEDEYLIV
ncbi:MAG: Type 1 glutamine amidotransferase-like domain-containing protein [Candidatus Dojkabacteria bacterium]|jgi:dipeptidase E